MEFEVIGFGKIAGITGASLRVSDVHDIDSLRRKLEFDFPLLKDTKYLVAVNKKMVTENISLENRAVIALMPPFSGG